jgi:hopene-associated glycosyltransferase HpnB
MLLTIIALAGASIWFIVLLLPWRPYGTKERLEALAIDSAVDLSSATVLMPARNESEVIATTLKALKNQGKKLKVILIDDQSDDNTVEIAKNVGLDTLIIIKGKTPPPDWTGKLWALEQGLNQVDTELTLLLDADIALLPGTIHALIEKMSVSNVQFVSLMAELRMQSFWEKMLMPAFVYFFKLLYPFQLSNSDFKWVAAAAGGCILIKTRLLKDMGGFGCLKNALIDDCTLAKQVKSQGYRTWIGLTHSVQSIRSYPNLDAIWNMVARTAFTQLRYSIALLLLCTALMALSFIVPVASLAFPTVGAKAAGAAGLLSMFISYLPTLRFYRLSALWALAMPFVGVLFLLMTWTSAFRYFAGKRSSWKGRTYLRKP